MFPASPVVLTETMLRQLDAFCEFGLFAANCKEIHAKTELFVLYVEADQIFRWCQTLNTLSKFSELDNLRFEVAEAFETSQSMM